MELTEALKPSATLLIKIGSLLVHYQELHGGQGHAFDKNVIDQLEADPDVVDWLETMTRGAFLPVRRDRAAYDSDDNLKDRYEDD